MPSIYDLKPKFQNLLRPLLNFLVNKKITPNMVTIAALIGSLIAGGLIAFAFSYPKLLLILPIWLFLRMALNAIDGMMAREYNMASNLGAVLNELGDVLSDCFIYLPLAFVNPEALWFIVFFSIGAIITEFSGLLGKALGVSRHYEGPMGKSDRAFIVGALSLFSAFFVKIISYWGVIFLILSLMTIWTSKNRIAKVLAELKESKK
ncbi:MAG: hypothetical protein ACD_79C00174G0004 [uncultured bacterium]|nr:MAG: hypothetical protein ACD_79C00174G0004 [uncultured bacterium]